MRITSGYGKSKSCTSGDILIILIELLKAVEDDIQMIRFNAFTTVFDGKNQQAINDISTE